MNSCAQLHAQASDVVVGLLPLLLLLLRVTIDSSTSIRLLIGVSIV